MQNPSESPAAAVLRRAETQDVVFADRPRRAALYGLGDGLPTTPLRVRVHRNVAAERLLTPAAAFAAWAGYDLRADYGPYDDSLGLHDLAAADPDVELVWIDPARLAALSADELAGLLVARIGALRERSGAPVLVLDVPADDPRAATVNAALAACAAATPAVHVGPLSAVAARFGDGFASRRADDLTAVPVAPAALSALGRALGLQWLPALAGRRVRAVAVDLDNTLYAGVLGEDGPAGLRLTDEHRALQQQLRELHDGGVFLAVVSRNERADVDALFAARPDFPLRAADVDAWGVSWGAKSAAVADAAAALRIAPDTVLFVDDNPGELVEVAAAHPGLATLHAADPAATRRGLALFPGLFRFGDAGADALRTRDLAAERERARLRTAEPGDYLAALRVHLDCAVDPAGQLARLAELSVKTNQFTTALARLGEVELAQRMRADDACVVSVRLRDRLSDSGVVGFLAARRDGTRLRVEDVCVSCRALGRGLERVMLDHLLARAAATLGADTVDLVVATGPRNAPAREWVAGFGDQSSTGDVVTTVTVPVPVPDPSAPVTVSWEPA